MLTSQSTQDYYIEILEVNLPVDAFEPLDHSIDRESKCLRALAEFHLHAMENYRGSSLFQATTTAVLNELGPRFA